VTETLTTRAGEILLLHAAASPAGYGLVLAPATSAPIAPLERGGLWQAARAAAGVARLPVAGGTRLHVLGAEQVLFLGSDGRVQVGASPGSPTGQVLTAAVPGSLILRHGPGILAAWAERDVDAAPPAAEALRVPGGLALAGPRQILRHTAREPTLLQVQTETPVVARWTAPGQDQVAVAPFGARLDFYSPPGEAWLTLQAVGDGVLSGSARFSATPVETIGEGVGPERLLAGGSARAFAFTLDGTRRVGLGIRASPDVVAGRLLDSRGQSLGEGVVHFPELSAGTYLLLAQTPPETAPVRVRAVALGLRAGGQGPPPELIRRFVQAGSDEGLISSLEAAGQAEATPVEGEDGAVEEEPDSGAPQADADPAEAQAEAQGEEGGDEQGEADGETQGEDPDAAPGAGE
jgi:hypothetical protein